MSNGDICRWAWENSKENRSALCTALLICLMPGLLSAGLAILSGESRLLSWWQLPLGWLGQMLSFGALFLALEPATGRKSALEDMTLPFHKEIRKKAALLALFFTVLTLILTLYPTFLIQKGQKIMAAAMEEINREWNTGLTSSAWEQYAEGNRLVTWAQRLELILTFPVYIMVLPAGYFLFFQEEKSVKEMIRDGCRVGFHSFGRFLGLAVRSMGILIVGCVLVVLIRGRFLPYLVLFVFLAYWFPWNQLAWAKLIRELIEVGPEDPWWART